MLKPVYYVIHDASVLGYMIDGNIPKQIFNLKIDNENEIKKIIIDFLNKNYNYKTLPQLIRL